ncbi:hypothetical protein [Candidatus Nanohalococcus occultus]|uniref:hypothetical protein n=1 Tax=Candidatus Nanohalococcus occultus TaxID=2978047 RepID=UPI0039E0E6CF
MENYNAETIKEQHWEETIDFLTKDMPADEIDIKVLAQRYREYIDTLKENDLAVSAKAIRVCSALLNLKAAITLDYEDEIPEQEQEPEPMDFEEEPEEEEELDLEEPPKLRMPPKPKPRRRMHKAELKDALRDAMEVKERREERREEREEMDHQFEFEEETIRDRIDSLYSKVTDLISSSSEKVRFSQLLDEKTSEEQIDKFMQVLTLENDRKVTCHQEEFLGELHVEPEDDEVAN